MATVNEFNIRTSNPRSDLEMATITGNSVRFLRRRLMAKITGSL